MRKTNNLRWGLTVQIRLREMRRSDLERVLEIERRSFANPWNRSMFGGELGKNNACYIVAEAERRSSEAHIMGYAGAWFLVPREVHVTNLAVDPDFRRRGLGRRLLRFLMDRAQNRRAEFITLEVRRSNRAARRLYLESGFIPCGVRRDYYRNDGEDAVIMSRRLEYSSGTGKGEEVAGRLRGGRW